MKKLSGTKEKLPKKILNLKKKIKKPGKSKSPRKPTEMDMYASELKYRQFAEDMPALICSFLPDSTLTYVNSAYCKLFSKRPEDLVGKKFLDFLPDKTTRKDVRRQYMSLTPENPVKTYEHKVIVADGTNQYHWHSWTDRAFFNDKREIIHFQSIGQDITDRKQAEEALRESESRYRLLAEHTKDIIWLMDMDTRTSYQSPSSEILRGFTVQELRDLPLDKNLTPNSLKLAMELLLSEIPKIEADPGYNPVHILELEYYRKDGTTVWLENKLSVIRDESGKPVSIMGEGRDITERKQAEAALRESEERFHKLADAAWEGIIIHREGTIMEANESALKTTGYSIEEIIGKNIITFVASESIEPVIQKLSEGTTHDQLFLELKLIRKDKSIFSAEALGRPIRYKNIDARVLAFRDITERRKTEEALRESEAKYRIITENTADQIAILDMDMHFIYISPNIMRLRGLTVDESMAQTLEQVLTPESMRLGLTVFEEEVQLEASGEADPDRTRILEVEECKKDGSTIWVEVNFSFLRDNDGKPVQIIMVSRDITERKRAEEKLQNTLESLRKAIGATIQVMVSAIESRDPYTAGHQKRSSALARDIATEMGLPPEKIDGIRMAGSIHDIGKMSIPSEILSKPTNLSEFEFPLIKEHAQKGYDILKDVESPWPLAEIVYQHHERMDGSGYPRNLKGEEILMEARILAVADVVESMASHRPYRPAKGIKVALEEIENNSGTLYDETVVDACLRLFREKGYQLEQI